MANINFDANQEKDAPSFQPLPAGQYVASINESAMKPSKDNPQNMILHIKWEVLEGQYKGRTLWQYLTYESNNADARQIGRGQLKAICQATGVMQVKSTDQLHGIPLVLTVGLEPRKAKDKTIIPGEFNNSIKKVISKKQAWEESQKNASAQPPAQQTQETAPAGAGSAPWAR